MDQFYKILLLLGSILLGYICGSLSFGTIISRKVYHKDIREHGSHNAGATNAGRVLGKKAGILVAILDIIKVVVPIWTVYLLVTKTALSNYCLISPSFIYYSVTLGSILGHCYPVFYGFKGGKAVSSMTGVILATNWLIAISTIILFFIVLKIKKYVSLASITAAIFVSLFSLLLFIDALSFTMWGQMEPGLLYSLFLTVETVILIIRHRENIKRLLSGTERKIKWMK